MLASGRPAEDNRGFLVHVADDVTLFTTGTGSKLRPGFVPIHSDTTDTINSRNDLYEKIKCCPLVLKVNASSMLLPCGRTMG